MAGPVTAQSPHLTAAMRLLDEAKAAGFMFLRTAPGEDAPLLGTRETTQWVDEIVLTGCSAEGSCYVSRRGRSSLVVPGGLPLVREVSGDALEVLHTVVTDWGTE